MDNNKENWWQRPYRPLMFHLNYDSDYGLDYYVNSSKNWGDVFMRQQQKRLVALVNKGCMKEESQEKMRQSQILELKKSMHEYHLQNIYRNWQLQKLCHHK